jgi:hypothetical protein
MSTSQRRRTRRKLERMKENNKTEMTYNEWLSQVQITPEMLQEMEEFEKAQESKPKVINMKVQNKDSFDFEEIK